MANDVEDNYYVVDEDEETRNIPAEDHVDDTGKAILENPLTDILIHDGFIIPQGD